MSGPFRLNIGRRLARYLSAPIPGYEPFCTYDVPVLEAHLQPADILLVEGDTRISTAIKYLTQSTWSHSAFYAGDATGVFTDDGEPCPLVEAELAHGVIASPLSKYRAFNTRICRPVGLTVEDRDTVVKSMVDSIGLGYDLKHIFDLARYLLRTPPIPIRYRRRMLAFGSGDPSRAICSTLIAETFQSIRYPILPRVEKKKTVISKYHNRRLQISLYHYSVQEILHIRHHSLFTPRDFDVSPYFKVIKPTVETGFDYRKLRIEDSSEADAADASTQ
ncbi:MAG: lipo-like protein [Gammaproteobacteria bacterium]|nr:lipo-like protein [Gammaproteobacteria bacterium]